MITNEYEYREGTLFLYASNTIIENCHAYGNVFRTNDYKSLKALKGQRPIVEKHVRNLKSKIHKKNLLHLFPLTVTKKGELFDGQHRLEAAESLGIFVYFCIASEDLTLGDLAMINNSQKKWASEDFIKSFLDSEDPFVHKESYKSLAYLCEAYDVKPYVALAMLDAADKLKNCKEGTLNLDKKPLRMVIAERVGKVMKLLDANNVMKQISRDKYLVRALCLIVRQDEYSYNTMKEKVEKYSSTLKRHINTTEYLHAVLEMYNKRNQKKLYIYERTLK